VSVRYQTYLMTPAAKLHQMHKSSERSTSAHVGPIPQRKRRLAVHCMSDTNAAATNVTPTATYA
jgi:hypothetical protein